MARSKFPVNIIVCLLAPAPRPILRISSFFLLFLSLFRAVCLCVRIAIIANGRDVYARNPSRFRDGETKTTSRREATRGSSYEADSDSIPNNIRLRRGRT